MMKPPLNSIFVLMLVSGIAGCVVGTRSGGASDRVSNSTGWDAAHVDTLLRLGREDQEGRNDLARAAAAQDTAVLLASMRADSARTRWLQAIVARRGWPSRAAVGDSAAKSAWLILQHSPDVAWQAALVPELERLGHRGEIPLGDVALLIDRVLVNTGKPQRYGSQFHVREGRLVPAPVEDLRTLDERRASMGLPPMADYVRKLGEMLKLPVSWPPDH